MTDGKWLTINDYSLLRNVSISTIRRHIKADRVKHKFESGKYYIFVNNDSFKRLESKNLDVEKIELKYKLEISDLNSELKKLREENAELKMLVKVYENKSPTVDEALENIFS